MARDPHYNIPGLHRIVQCAQCSLVFVNPMPRDQELAQLYPADYYAYNSTARAGRLKEVAKRLLGYWSGARDPHFESPGTFLDIGCGCGTHVERMRDLGWKAYGVEISGAAARAAGSKGLQVFCGTLQHAHFPDRYFDYVRASHVLEHLTCPHETLEEIYRILKPGGKVMIAVPNIRSLSARIFKQYWWHLCPPIHVLHYSGGSLTRMLQQHNLCLEDLAFNSDYVGVLGSVQIWLNRGNGRRSSEGSIFANRPLRVLSGWLERLCDLFRCGDMIEVTAARL